MWLKASEGGADVVRLDTAFRFTIFVFFSNLTPEFSAYI